MNLKLLYVGIFSVLISTVVHAANPYVELSKPSDLLEIHVNIENYQPTGKPVKKTEISYGDGTVITNVNNSFHKYTTHGKRNVTIKSWDSQGVLSSYIREVDVDSRYRVQDIPNSMVFSDAIGDKRSYSFSLSTTQASKLYKLKVKAKPSSQNNSSANGQCRLDVDVKINNISFFNADELNCNTVILEKFVRLKAANEMIIEGTQINRKRFSYEISAVEIIKDVEAPVLSSNIASSTLTKNNQVIINVIDESLVTTYVWNDSQTLMYTSTSKNFFIPLAEGMNNFVLKSVDEFGNASEYFYLSNIKSDTIPASLNSVLAGEYIYGTYPQDFQVTINTNEDLQYLSVNDVPALWVGPQTYSYTLHVEQPGQVDINLFAIDLAGNESTKVYSPLFSQDAIAPVISSSLAVNELTSQNFTHIKVIDNATTTTEVYNSLGQLIKTTSEKEFDIQFTEQGLNSFVVKSRDLYNNEALDLHLDITYDSLAPVVSSDLANNEHTNRSQTVISVVDVSTTTTEVIDAETNEVIQSTSSKHFSIAFTKQGMNSYIIRSKDTLNFQSQDLVLNVFFDSTVPVISSSLADNSLTKIDKTRISISDISDVVTRVYDANHQLLKTVSAKEFDLEFPIQGLNKFYIQSTDDVGNVSQENEYAFTYDSIAPTLAEFIEPLYFAKDWPKNLSFNFNTNEALSEFLVNGESVSPNENGVYTYLKNYASEGQQSLQVQLKDLAGNTLEKTFNFEINFDDEAPSVTIGQVPDITNQNDVLVSFQIADENSVTSEVRVNNVLIATVFEKNFSYLLSLSEEGVNTISVISLDTAGNQSEVLAKQIIKDTVAPTILALSPANGAISDRISFSVSAKSDEILESASINGSSLSVDQTGKLVSGTFYSSSTGQISLNWVFKDLAGNEKQVDTIVQVQNKLLIQELVTVSPSLDGKLLRVAGSVGAIRGRAKVNVSEGFFSLNSAEGYSAEDGSFYLDLKPFQSATLTVTDENTNEIAQMDLSYQVNTVLSGIVLDSSGNPLPGATISLQSSGVSATTNSAGAFQFDPGRTGDQMLVIDGRSIPQLSDGIERTFSVTNIAINIGMGQNNALSRPIYLHPIYHDDTETYVEAGSPAVVESPHAPGVTLNIPANSITFPDGSTNSAISIATIPAEFATVQVPQAAVPTSVLALEPSGVSFEERVELTLPNDGDLPPGTNMIIISMNSKSGSWEADGLAQVNETGDSIITTPGNGISHFSLVYAVPVKPTIAEVKNPNLVGVDISQGSMSTKVSLPFYKAFGKSIIPSLTYKSSWANPTAIVSNIFDIPTQETSVEYHSTYGRSEVKRFMHSYCGYKNFQKRCYDDIQEYWIETQYQNDLSVKSSYVPESIKSQFFVSNITSKNVQFQNAPASGSTLPGVSFPEGSNTEIHEVNGIPNRSLISYAVSLKDPENNNTLESGIYPTLARYQLKLRNLTMTSYTRTFTAKVNGAVQNVQVATNNTASSRVLDEVFPSDLQSTIIVQNKSKSPFGKGWNLNLAQKILNPNSNQIVIEEKDGSVATYTLNNTISTVADGNTLGVSFSKVASLQKYPKVLTQLTNSSGADFVTEVDVRTADQVKVNRGSFPTTLYQYTFDNYESCKPRNNIGNFGKYYYPYRIPPRVDSYVQLPDNRILGLNGWQHQVFEFNDQVHKKFAGSDHQYAQFSWSQPPGPLFKAPYWSYDANVPNANTIAECRSHGYFCVDAPVQTYTRKCPNGIGFSHWMFEAPPATGPYPQPGYADGYIYHENYYDTINFNSPKSMILSPSGEVIIADTGNNRVRKISFTNYSSTIAGNGGNTDSGDHGPATEASMFHPRGLTYDDSGNLYISTENGYIRKVNAQGNIETIAGKPLGQGGVLANEAPADRMAFVNPTGMVFDNTNNILYVADTGNHRVVKIELDSMSASTVAGTGQCNPTSLDENKSALTASICSPLEVGLDSDKNLIIVNSGRNKIQVVRFNNSQGGLTNFSPTNKDLSTLVRNSDNSWTRKFRDGSSVQFNDAGLQTSESDRIGNSATLSYNSNQQLIRIVDPTNQSLNIGYSGEKISYLTDPAGKSTSFGFQGDYLTLVTFPDGSTKRYQYDSNGLLTNEFDALQNETKYIYNEHNRLSRIIAPNLHETFIDDQESNSIDSEVLNQSNVAENGLSTSIGDSYSDSSFAKDHMGLVSSIKDAEGKITKIQRDENGNVTKMYKPDQSEVELKYDPITNDLIESYDIQSNIRKKNTFNAFGQVVTSTDPAGNIYTNEFNAANGLLTKEKSPLNGIETSYIYTAKGEVSQRIQKNGLDNFVTITTYDSKGNAKEIVDADNKKITSFYDLSGNVIRSIISVSSTAVSETQYEYDVMNRLIKVISPKGEATEYTYTANGQLSSTKDSQLKLTQFFYDNMSQLIKKEYSTGEVFTFDYDPNGQWKTETDPNGVTKRQEFDKAGRIVKVILPDDLVTHEYDSFGRLKVSRNNNSQITYTKDSVGRTSRDEFQGLGQFSWMSPFIVKYDYDTNSNKIKTTLNDSIVFNYSYDALKRLKQIDNSLGDTFVYQYDDLSRVTKLTRPGGETNYLYKRNNLISDITHKSGSSVVSQFQYQYDLRNLITQKRNLASTENYIYDLNGQLMQTQRNIGVSESFAYDSNGNRLSDSFGTFTYDTVKSRLNEDYKYVYLYDNNGNLIAKSPKNQSEKAFRYEYTSVNQLKSVKTLSNPFGSIIHQVNYSYDVLGRRMNKEVIDSISTQNSSNTLYQYDEERMVVESKSLTQSGASGVAAIYTHSLKVDDVLSMAIPSTGVTTKKGKISGKYYFLKDHVGSVHSIVDSVGSIKQSYKYTSFGAITGVMNGNNVEIANDPFIDNQYTFTGREFDKENNTYFYRGRYYDASIGRFLQQDPHPGHLDAPNTVVNKYIYAVNNPISLTDPFGDNIFKDIGRAFASLVITALLPAILAVSLTVGIFDPALGLSIAMLGVQFSSLGQIVNKVVTGRFASLESYQGMPMVKDSMFGGRGGFTPGPVSFIGGGNWDDEFLKRHEYGHHLQYKKHGGWWMASKVPSILAEQFLGMPSNFECEPGVLARDYFNPNASKNPYTIGYVSPYHGSYAGGCLDAGYY